MQSLYAYLSGVVKYPRIVYLPGMLFNLLVEQIQYLAPIEDHAEIARVKYTQLMAQ